MQRTHIYFVFVVLIILAIAFKYSVFQSITTIGATRAFGSTNNKHRKSKFYILPLEEITTWLLGNFSTLATEFYNNTLNEEQGEIWLHKGLIRLPYRTENVSEADVVIICAYLHLNNYLNSLNNERRENLPLSTDEWLKLLDQRLILGKIHVVAVPTWNPERSRKIGLKKLTDFLISNEYIPHVVSFGYERNPFWQHIEPQNIIPIPYVVNPSLPKNELLSLTSDTYNDRVDNFVFYAGDVRKHAQAWAGCNRTRILSTLLQSSNNDNNDTNSNIDVRIVSKTNRISQDEYNTRMYTSDYCLILCGDTPTSRSLSSSMVYGCIPIFVGSRYRGQCTSPCHPGWGWVVTNNHSHRPFENLIEWKTFPEVEEEYFALDGVGILQDVFRHNQKRKNEIRNLMQTVQKAWIYGWGNPTAPEELGEAAFYAWMSLESHVSELVSNKHQ